MSGPVSTTIVVVLCQTVHTMREPSRRPGPRPADPATARQDRRELRRRQQRRRRRLAAAIFTCAAVLAAAGMGAWLTDTDEAAIETAPTPTAPTPRAAPATQAPPATEAPPVLSMPGDYPDDGPGTFRYASTEGQVLGESGTLMRFRVAVEDTVDEDPDELAEYVDETLGAEQGWTAGGNHRFQRVPADAAYEFTIHLVTSQTAGRMCGSAGLNVLAPSLPEGGVSCYYSGHVVLNLSRWMLSVPHYVDDEVPLDVYRRMVLNHEVGHALGLGHEACPGPGEPAPVMQQQTLRLDGCEAYEWPYLDGQRYAGEPVP